MKVLFDHQIFCTQRYGGFSKYFTSLARALVAMEGVEAKIVAPAHINGYLDSKISGICSFRLPFMARGLNHRVVAIAPVFRSVAGFIKPDVVHETHYILDGHHVPKSAAIVATCHDMIVEKGLHMDSDQLNGIRAKRQALERSDFIICISKNTQNDLLNLYPQLKDRTVVVHHGVTRVVPSTASGANIPKQYLLYVGVRAGYKNFENFLRAFANSTRLRSDLEIVCFGGGRCTPDELKLFAELAIPVMQIHFLAGDDAFLAHVYANAAALVYPSAYEGFGMPLTEAMIQGCPVVSSRTSSLPEVCLDAAEYFDPENLEEMGSAIENVVFNSARRQELVTAGLQRSTAFTWESCASSTLSVYRHARECKDGKA